MVGWDDISCGECSWNTKLDRCYTKQSQTGAGCCGDPELVMSHYATIYV